MPATRIHISLMKQQFVVTRTIRHTKLLALRQSVCKHTVCQSLLSTKNCFSLFFRNSVTSLNAGILRICKFFSVCRRTVYRRVTTNCCFMSVKSKCHYQCFSSTEELSSRCPLTVLHAINYFYNNILYLNSSQ